MTDNQQQPFQKRGLHNWKNLFKKPSASEIIILIMLIMAVGLGFAYKHDTQVCRDTLANIKETACQICNTNTVTESYAGSIILGDKFITPFVKHLNPTT